MYTTVHLDLPDILDMSNVPSIIGPSMKSSRSHLYIMLPNMQSILRYIFSDKVLALEKPETSLRISPIMPSGCGIYVGRRITKASIRIRLSKTTTKNFWFLSGTDFIFTIKYLIYGMCIYKIFMYNKI